MTNAAPLRISYCTTCKGRLHHLKQTLPANLKAEAGNPNVEFVVLDYDSKDGLGDWIRATFPTEIASGRLRYARFDNAPYFKMAHAKNMAHRLATGDVLCNLDADNFLAPDFSQWLSRTFTSNMNRIVSCITPTPLRYKLHNFLLDYCRLSDAPGGLGGRIAISKSNFELLGGYDEAMSAWGGDDSNFCFRASAAGVQTVALPKRMWGSVIDHDNELRLSQLSDKDRACSVARLKRGRTERRKQWLSEIERIQQPIANADGKVGCGEVRINFASEPTVIAPLGCSPGVIPDAPAEAVAATSARRIEWSAAYSPEARQFRGSPTRY